MRMDGTVKVDWLDGKLCGGRTVSVAELHSILEKNRQKLACFSISELIEAFRSFSETLLDRSCSLIGKYPESGIPFLARWCGGDNLSNMIADSLGSLDVLDGFVPRINTPNREVRAFSRGIVVHWLAGNVPTLGLLSLLSGILTKNANIVRIPSKSDGLLAELMAHLNGLGALHAVVADTVAVIRYNHVETGVAESVSRIADVRIIWGGDESSAAIKALPCKATCTDLVFPDRTSFIVVGKSYLAPEKLAAVTRLIAHDASVFEQKACASPHTIFLDVDDDKEVGKFCQALLNAMQKMLKTIPKRPPSQNEVQVILNLRAQYDMFYEAWYFQGTEFSILSDDKTQLGPPVGNRTIYVRKLPAMDELAFVLPVNIQSVGLACDADEFEFLTLRLGLAGVHRFTPMGAMTSFEIPWDGFMVPQYLVRWTTRQSWRTG